MNLTWKYNYQSSTLKLFKGDNQVGFLKANIWTPFYAQGELYGNKYIFKSKGLFNSNTLILNAETHEVEGNIKGRFHPLIKLIDQQASKLNFRNIWMTNWRLVGNQAYRIQFNGGYFNGKFSWNERVPIALVLASFYARNKAWEMTIFFLLALLIWFTSRGL